jgi:hypothetical protein
MRFLRIATAVFCLSAVNLPSTAAGATNGNTYGSVIYCLTGYTTPHKSWSALTKVGRPAFDLSVGFQSKSYLPEIGLDLDRRDLLVVETSQLLNSHEEQIVEYKGEDFTGSVRVTFAARNYRLSLNDGTAILISYEMRIQHLVNGVVVARAQGEFPTIAPDELADKSALTLFSNTKGLSEVYFGCTPLKKID